MKDKAPSTAEARRAGAHQGGDIAAGDPSRARMSFAGANRLAWRQFGLLGIGILLFAGLYGAATARSPVQGAMDGLIYGAVIGLPLALVESHARRLPPVAATFHWSFGRMVAIKSAAYAVWIVIGAAIAEFLIHDPVGRPLSGVAIHRETVATAVVASVVANALLAADRLLGPGVFFRFLSGRYHKPRQEQRVILFVDIRNSTAIAEDIGDLAFHSYLNDAFRLMGRAALECGAEIYDYIGDQAILTWSVGRTPVQGPLEFLVTLHERLARERGTFWERHGRDLHFRAVVHVGAVVAGEIGEFKQKVALLGDTINATARLEQLAREQDETALATREALDGVRVPPRLVISPLGTVPLRGRAQPIEVFRLWLSIPRSTAVLFAEGSLAARGYDPRS